MTYSWGEYSGTCWKKNFSKLRWPCIWFSSLGLETFGHLFGLATDWESFSSNVVGPAQAVPMLSR